MSKSMPFPPEAVDMPNAPIDPITANLQAVQAKYEKDKEAHRKQAVENANQAWKEKEEARKQRFIREYLDDYTELENPYEGKSPGDIFRLTRDYSTRISDLLAVGLYEQSFRVWLYRRGGKANIADVKAFLKPHIPVNGDKTIRTKPLPTRMEFIVHAEGLSEELRTFLRCSGIETRFGVVSWVVGEVDDHSVGHTYRKVLAPEELPKEEW